MREREREEENRGESEKWGEKRWKKAICGRRRDSDREKKEREEISFSPLCAYAHAKERRGDEEVGGEMLPIEGDGRRNFHVKRGKRGKKTKRRGRRNLLLPICLDVLVGERRRENLFLLSITRARVCT